MGGLERQIIKIAETLADSSYSVFILTLDTGEVQTFYQFKNENIQIIPINHGNPDTKASFRCRLNRQRLIYKELKSINPDIGISFMFGGYLMSILSMRILRRPLILAERNSPEMYRLTSARKYRLLIFALMLLSSKITVQFESYKNKYPMYLRNRIRVIPNAIAKVNLSRKSNSTKVRYVFAGRFSDQKQVVRLVEAFHAFHSKYNDVSLHLFGEGELRHEVIQKIGMLQAHEFIQLNPPSDLKLILENADILCIPSKWEGFPNILAESLLAGIPGLGFSNCDGVSDLLTEQVNGWISTDDGSIECLSNLLERSFLGFKSGKLDPRITVSSVTQYSDERVKETWLKVLNECRRTV